MRCRHLLLLMLWMAADTRTLRADESQLLNPADAAADLHDDAVRFFESRIRPVLVDRCYKCHAEGSRPLQGSLRLDTAAGLRQGGDSGPAINPDLPSESLLLSALRYDGLQMPPDGQLPDDVISDFEKWLVTGAVDPRKSDSDTDSRATQKVDLEKGRQFWAFQPPQTASIPELDSDANSADVTRSSQNRIDALIQRRLMEHHLQQADTADRRTIIRRLYFDLTGLPPSPEDVASFVQETSSQTFTATVDRLLNSPAYGERWARVWLDLARYAEDQAHIVGSNKELFYPNAWRYREWVIGALNADLPYDQFVSLQLAADLIAPEDEQVQAALGFIGLGPKYYRRNDPEVMAEEWEDRVDVVTRGLQGLTVACARCHDHKYDPIPTEDYYALAGVFAGVEMFNKPIPGSEVGKNGVAKNPDEAIHVVRDMNPRDLQVMIRGNVRNPGKTVARGFLQVVFPGESRKFVTGSGRLELAQAITDSANPLTARVIVNRIWQQYFGRGLVGTSSNFGLLGERPTHPDLLDDLAVRFMQQGWSLKWLHREIVLSDTYQQSSAISAADRTADPGNALLWRMPRRRLSVEGWRDAVLAVSGRLQQTIGGKSIRPDDPEQTRRTIYSEVSRFQLNPLLARFDFPDPNTHSDRRVETDTPLQKLFLLNSPFMLKQAEFFADRIVTQGTADTKQSTDQHLSEELNSVARRIDQQITAAFQLALQRIPDSEEYSATFQFLKEHPDDGLRQLAQNLLVSNEFWHLD